MKILFLLGAMVCFGLPLYSQEVPAGQRLFYDSISRSFLTTVPRSQFAANEKHIVSHADCSGTIRQGRLRYTFLPIIQLRGTFNNDYHEALVLLAAPDGSAVDTLPASVKWRGGSTNGADKHKRNFKIKLKNDTTLLGLRNDNNWILDAGQADAFRMRNKAAMDLWAAMGSQPYYADEEPQARLSISGHVVELFVNDVYYGIYNFAENIDRKQLKIKKVSADGSIRGCLYKSKGWGLGQMYSIDSDYNNRSETWQTMEAKYPDLNDCDTTDWSTLANAIHFVVNSSNHEFAEQVEAYFDLPVLTDFYIFGSALNAYDNRGKNLFWAVYNKNKDKKLTLAPWDLDCTTGQRWFGTISDEAASPDTIVLMMFNLTRRLSQVEDCHFLEHTASRYRQLRGSVLSTGSLIDLYTSLYRQMDDSGALHREEERWSGDTDISGQTLDITGEFDYICSWISRHMQAMDDYFGLAETQGVHSLRHNDSQELVMYNLNGQRTSAAAPTPQPGIYVRNGKKIIIR